MFPADVEAFNSDAYATECEFKPPAVYAVHNPNAADPVASGPFVALADGVGSGVGVAVSVASSVDAPVGAPVAVCELGTIGNAPLAAATAVPPPMATRASAASATLVPTAVAMNDTSGTSRLRFGMSANSELLDLTCVIDQQWQKVTHVALRQFHSVPL
jgi:hypothetical protein